MSPTARTLARLRKLGWTAAITEHWNPHAHIRQDLFGGIDIVALRGEQTMGVQCTSASNLANRVEKLKLLPAMFQWIRAGNLLECWGWVKRGARWEVCVIELTCKNFSFRTKEADNALQR